MVEGLGRRDFLKEAFGVAVYPFLRNLPLEANVELPKDTVSEDELRSVYAVNLHHTDKVRFFIRRKALEVEPIFPYLKANRIKGSSLDVILVDAVSVGLGYLTEEQKALFNRSDYNYLVESQIQAGEEILSNEQVRLIAGERYREGLEYLDLGLSNTSISKDQYDLYKEMVDLQFKPFLETPSRLDKYYIGGETLKGMAMINPHDNFYLLCGVGDKTEVQKKSLVVGYDSLIPDPSQSYPSPEEYRMAVIEEILALTSGTLMRHEWGHICMPGRKKPLLCTEDEANNTAMEILARANQAFFEGGDDSLYYFGFVTEKGITLAKNLNRNRMIDS
jgi:hypothetical protein